MQPKDNAARFESDRTPSARRVRTPDHVPAVRMIGISLAVVMVVVLSWSQGIGQALSRPLSSSDGAILGIMALSLLMGMAFGLTRFVLHTGTALTVFLVGDWLSVLILQGFPATYRSLASLFPTVDIVGPTPEQRQLLLTFSRELRDHGLVPEEFHPIADWLLRFPGDVSSFNEMWAWALSRMLIVGVVAVVLLPFAFRLVGKISGMAHDFGVKVFGPHGRWSSSALRAAGEFLGAMNSIAGALYGYGLALLLVGTFYLFAVCGPFRPRTMIAVFFAGSELAAWCAKAAEPLIRLLVTLVARVT